MGFVQVENCDFVIHAQSMRKKEKMYNVNISLFVWFFDIYRPS